MNDLDSLFDEHRDYFEAAFEIITEAGRSVPTEVSQELFDNLEPGNENQALELLDEFKEKFSD